MKVPAIVPPHVLLSKTLGGKVQIRILALKNGQRRSCLDKDTDVFSLYMRGKGGLNG